MGRDRPSSAPVDLDPPIDFEVEDDGRWIAAVPTVAGVLAYGMTRDEAEKRVRDLLTRVFEDRRAAGE